jgi:cysteine desulfurase
MNAMPVYLDYNATTPVGSEVLDALLPYMQQMFGNPSSNHVYGFRLRSAIDAARAQVAGLIGASPDEIVFTSCGSEANNLAIKGVAFALRDRGDHLITSAVEHAAVFKSMQFLATLGFQITVLPVDSHGCLDPADVERAITKRTILVSVIHGQNEIGTLQPVREIAEIARSRSVLVHSDAAQTVGKIPMDVKALGVDLLSIAGNKCYAPKGSAALFVRKGVSLEPLIHGGGQESGRRAGTENAAFAVALGKTAELAPQRIETYSGKVRPLRDLLQKLLCDRIPNAILNGHPIVRLPNTVNLSFPGVDSSELLSRIGDRVACSTGSSCHSGKSMPSAILLAIGRTEALASSALRLSLGIETTREQVERSSEIIASAVLDLQA